MDTNITKEPIASIFEVEYHATHERTASGTGKKSQEVGPMTGCILLSALDYLIAKVQGKLCLQTYVKYVL